MKMRIGATVVVAMALVQLGGFVPVGSAQLLPEECENLLGDGGDAPTAPEGCAEALTWGCKPYDSGAASGSWEYLGDHYSLVGGWTDGCGNKGADDSAGGEIDGTPFHVDERLRACDLPGAGTGAGTVEVAPSHRHVSLKCGYGSGHMEI